MERDESKFVIKYASHMLPSAAHGITRFDSCFYAGEGYIATVLYEGFAVDIYCDGITKVNLLNSPQGQVVRVLYSASDFIDAGLNTDDAVKLANEQGLLDWVNNSWFDLYCYGEHFDMPSHMLNEAIDMAKEYVYAEYFNAETLLDMPDMLDK